MKRTTVTLPDEIARLIDEERRNRDVPSTTVIQDAVEAFLLESSEPVDTRSRRFRFIGIIGDDLEPSDYASHDEEIIARGYSKWIAENSGLTEYWTEEGAEGRDTDKHQKGEVHEGNR